MAGALIGAILNLASSGTSSSASHDASDAAEELQKSREEFYREQLRAINPFGSKNLFSGPKWAHDQLESLRDSGIDFTDFLTRRIPITKAEKNAGRFFNKKFPGMIDQAVGRVSDLYPYAQELVETGFRPDTEAIKQAEQYRLATETRPNIREDLANFGPGSAMQSAYNKASTDLGYQFADLDLQADMFASRNRIAGLPVAQDLAAAPSTLGAALNQIMGDQGEAWRNRRESVRPGALPNINTIFPTIAGISGIEQQQVFPVPGNVPGQAESNPWWLSLISTLTNPGVIDAGLDLAQGAAQTYNINLDLNDAFANNPDIFGSNFGSGGGSVSTGTIDTGLSGVDAGLAGQISL